MTLQDEINQAALKTYKQGRLSISKARCAYQGVGGDRCAIGHMMTDAELEKFGKSIGDVHGLINEGWRSGVYKPTEVHKLKMLQQAHDVAHGENFQKAFLGNLDKETREYVEKHIPKSFWQRLIDAIF